MIEYKTSKAPKFDLEERTAKFGERIIDFIKTIPRNNITSPLVDQLIRSATSVGANYMEADGAESKKDFRHKISICKKEAKESRHWIRMIANACSERKTECRVLWKEANELSLIFSSIVRNTGKK
ncbi:four helix bundle protein [Patescibacteria group bacterium]|nr:four helix bundle protein [Patescibacteria group bacterium]MBU1123043.1 four helix bundle protein [Patescibacteria group bacterium]MBU1911071.1 four helix bundle protein [Patescibacteria group bacterium]